MNHNYYTCDHCGKRLDYNDPYTDTCAELKTKYWEMDLCDECYNELADLIGRFVSAGKEKDNNERES